MLFTSSLFQFTRYLRAPYLIHMLPTASLSYLHVTEILFTVFWQPPFINLHVVYGFPG